MSEASRYMPRSRNRGARRDAKEYRCDGVDQCAAADAAAGFFGSAPSAPWTPSRWPAAPPRVLGRSASSECSLLRRGAREEGPGGSG